MRERWLWILTAVLLGTALGLGSFTFVYARGYSYLSDDPSACANCHIMGEHYDAWTKSSHSALAMCNDCHTPHDNLVSKYWVKAKNGFWHSFYFTTGEFPYPIRITDPNHEVVEQACRDCHQAVTETVDHGLPEDVSLEQAQDCTHCHSIVDPAVWGQNFPLHYELYMRTVDMVRTRYGGSEAIPQQPVGLEGEVGSMSYSRLEEDPRLREFWAGYSFAEDFREERGHAYMFIDQMTTRRQDVAEQPGTCLHCHASTYTVYRDAGDGDLMEGFRLVNQMPYEEAAALAEHPIACIDCHEPETMQLRVTRPGFIEGVASFLGDDLSEDFDINEDASRAEMRTFVCAQCHVEYYFAGEERRLTYPWANGLRADDVLAYYEEIGFSDWTHAVTDGPALKAQHPEFELYSQGVHARSGVACADCHMPYMRVGARKVSDHWVRSPMLNVNNACQTCHVWSEDELRSRVHTIQDRTYQLRNIAIDATLELARAIERADAGEADQDRLDAARTQHRRAQFLADYIEAENSMGFHADQEAARVLGLSINYERLGQMALSDDDPPEPAPPLQPAPPQTVVPGTGGENIFTHRMNAGLDRPGAIEPTMD